MEMLFERKEMVVLRDERRKDVETDRNVHDG